MKAELPELMRERGLDALLVLGPDGKSCANPAFAYFIGSAHVTTGVVIVRADGSAFLLHHTMDRDEAAKTDLKLIDRSRYNYPALLRANNGDPIAAQAALLCQALRDVEAGPRVGIYGVEEVSVTLRLVDALRRDATFTVVAEGDDDVITRARKTKDRREAALIQQVCQLAEEVIAETQAFLQAHRAHNGCLVRPDGAALTVGDVKRFIRARAAERNLHGADCIFAVGRDAGVPHSAGNESDPIQVGRAIVFDFFPRGPEGYHADITRTWCLGFAPPEVERAWQTVLEAHALAERSFNLRDFTWAYNEAVCDLFEARGYTTLRQDPRATRGYVHSLGHGFGLAVHEAPSISLKGWRPDEVFQPGTVFCSEPGLYDPEAGWGVRVEDDYWFDEQGVLHRLTRYPHDLVIPLREG